MLYIPWMVILCVWSQYQKNIPETLIFEVPRVKKCISRLCTNPLGAPAPPTPTPQTHSAPYKPHGVGTWKPHGVGTWKHLFGSK